MRLPADFSWEAQPDGAPGARLELDGHAVLQIRACRSGWLITVLMHDPLHPQPDVAVRSVAAGMRWSARWAHGRISRLRMLAAERASAAQDVSALPSRGA